MAASESSSSARPLLRPPSAISATRASKRTLGKRFALRYGDFVEWAPFGTCVKLGVGKLPGSIVRTQSPIVVAPCRRFQIYYYESINVGFSPAVSGELRGRICVLSQFSLCLASLFLSEILRRLDGWRVTWMPGISRPPSSTSEGHIINAQAPTNGGDKGARRAANRKTRVVSKRRRPCYPYLLLPRVPPGETRQR